MDCMDEMDAMDFHLQGLWSMSNYGDTITQFPEEQCVSHIHHGN